MTKIACNNCNVLVINKCPDIQNAIVTLFIFTLHANVLKHFT